MKVKIVLMIIFISCIVAFSNEIYAASLTVSASSSVTVGESYTATITANGLTGKVSISASGGASISSSSAWLENSSTSITVTPSSVGTVTISASGVLADSITAEESSYSNSCSTTIKEKVVEEVKVEEPVATAPEITQPTPANNKKKTINTKSKIKVIEEATPQLGIVSLELYSVNEQDEKVLLELDKAFDINVFEYLCTVSSDIKSIEVVADAKEYNDILKIEGGEELVVGENIIKLKLTNNDKTLEYVVKVIKEKTEIIEEESVTQLEEKNKEKWTDKIVSFKILTFIFLIIGILTVEPAIYFGIKFIINKRRRMR